MKILKVTHLVFPEIRVIRYQRSIDERGYFTEIYRKSDFDTHPELSFLANTQFIQCNESFSKAGVLRGMHFQWDYPMGKLVRAMMGHLIDLILDIRVGSPTYGKMIAYDMPVNEDQDYGEWIWVPQGFAHGILFPQSTRIIYFCTASWNPEAEASISPLAPDIDWSLCDTNLYDQYKEITQSSSIVSEKDRNGFTLSEWSRDERSKHFLYAK
jgi:dTDP-4-dehydrorhamnose 3,5-epimerase